MSEERKTKKLIKKKTVSGKFSGARIVDEAKKNYFSLFPDDDSLRTLIPNSFVINRPMNAVGGDGYWVHKAENCYYLVIFDCMGHGHLASMMTRVYTNVIKTTIEGNEDEFPNRMLMDIHEEIKSKFEGKENIILGTGADFGIVKINLDLSEMEYAGARMNLFEVTDGNLNLIKADRMQIGDLFDYHHEYKTNIIALREKSQSSFYLLSDGVKDLIGGPNNRKLGSSRLKELLEQASKYDMPKQKQYISNYLSVWKGSNQALDDALIIGFNLPKSFFGRA
ncbi:MAG: SpoIIE family protein phosphatase [Cyclobacteriaceae bacterium]